MGLRAHAINEQDNFIGGWYLDDTAICDELIRYHRESPEKQSGQVSGYMGKGGVNKEQKDSTDVLLPDCELTHRYLDCVYGVAAEYVAKYDYAGKLVPWGVIETINLQHYSPGGGFKIWHFERDNTNDQIARRHLAFMTYLNDVTDSGGTSFHYQGVTIQPEKGLTLFWPSEWTHTHKGEVSPTQEKYITTGWMSTYTRDEYMALRNGG